VAQMERAKVDGEAGSRVQMGYALREASLEDYAPTATTA